MKARMLRLLPQTQASTIGHLTRPVVSVPASTACADIDVAFRRDERIPCFVVRDEAGRLGLVSRTDFQQRMAGPLGYGRLLLGRRSLGELTDWSPILVDEHAQVAEVARLVLDRQATHGVSQVLVVRSDGAVGHAPVRALFESLAAQFAARAVTDSLTQLANRDLFLDALDLHCQEAADDAGPVAVLYIDLDGFKTINDAWGHAAGDEALRITGARLRSCFRAEDVVARLGGDEFGAIMSLNGGQASAEATATAIARRALAALSDVMNLHGTSVPGRASVGLAISRGARADSQTLLREADLAMYRAKAAGGSALEIVRDVDCPLDGAASLRRADRERLLSGIAQEEFVLHYQPIVNVHTGRLASVEALVRWDHPVRGLLAPGEFLANVEAAGLARELGAHVLRTACRQLALWRSALGRSAPPRINVNLSVTQLLDPAIVPTALEALAAFDLPADVLRLELPEVATVAQMRQARVSLDALRAAGVAVTLDDLGAGASSLTHLTQVPLDGIKIDRQFVAGMLSDNRDMAVVRMLLELAHAMGLFVTAEGVETQAQLAALREVSAGRSAYLQGFLVCRPMAAAELPLPWAAGTEDTRSLAAYTVEL